MPNVPKYNYLGPGTKSDGGKAPVNKLDAIAQKHDQSYDQAHTVKDIISSDYAHGKAMISNTVSAASVPEAALSVASGTALILKAGQHKLHQLTGIPNPLQYPTNSVLADNQQKVIEKTDNRLHGRKILKAKRRMADSTSQEKPSQKHNAPTNDDVDMRDDSHRRKAGSGEADNTNFIMTPQPGLNIRNGWRMPDPQSAHYKKHFLLEVDNAKFECGTLTTAIPENYCIPPYYVFTWWWIGNYLTFGEFSDLRRHTSYAKVKSIKYTVDLVGNALTFPANNDATATANSEVDIHLDIFRSLEKSWPFEIGFKGDGGDFTPIDTSSTGAGYHHLAKSFYGYGAYKHGTYLSGMQAYSDLKYRPRFTTLSSDWRPNEQQTPKPPTNEAYGPYLTWPNFQSKKWATADARNFRGTLFTIEYEPSNGIIGFAPSVKCHHPLKGVTPIKHKLYKYLRNNKMETLTGVDSDAYYEAHTDFNGSKRVDNAPDYAVHTHALKSDTQKEWLCSTIESEHLYSSRQESHLQNFQSVLMGMRPIMNGSKLQEGKLYFEINTEIEVEYQDEQVNAFTIDWQHVGDTQVGYTPVHEGFTGLTNDLDILFTNHMYPSASYGWGGKHPRQFNASVDFLRHIEAQNAKSARKQAAARIADTPVFGMGFH